MTTNFDKRIKLIAIIYPILILIVSLSEFPHVPASERWVYFSVKMGFSLSLSLGCLLYLKKRWAALTIIIGMISYLYGSYSQFYRPLYFINYIQTTCFYPLFMPISQRNYVILILLGSATYLSAFFYTFETYQIMVSQTQQSDIVTAIITTSILGIVLNSTLSQNRSFQYESLEKFSVIGQVSTAIAHNVKGMIASPLFDLDLLRKEALKNSNKRLSDKLDRVYKKIERSETILRDLNYIAHVAHESKDWISLEEIVTKSASLLELQKKGITVKCDDQCEVYGDRTQFESIFISFFLNSKKALISKHILNPEIRIYCSDSMINISDNGPGFSESILTQLNQGSFPSENPKGGVGIYVVTNLIQRMGGTLSFNNKEGALVAIKLPSNRIRNKKVLV